MHKNKNMHLLMNDSLDICIYLPNNTFCVNIKKEQD